MGCKERGRLPAQGVVQQGDVAALREALAGLLADPARRASLGEAAAERAELFSVEAIGERYVTLLNDAITRRARA